MIFKRRSRIRIIDEYKLNLYGTCVGCRHCRTRNDASKYCIAHPKKLPPENQLSALICSADCSGIFHMSFSFLFHTTGHFFSISLLIILFLYIEFYNHLWYIGIRTNEQMANEWEELPYVSY